MRQLIVLQPSAASITAVAGERTEPGSDEPGRYQEVDLDSLDLVRPRSVGVEHAALSAMRHGGFEDKLGALGLNRPQIAAAVGNIIGHMAHPGSELATHAWLQQRSALGELIGFDLEAMESVFRSLKTDLGLRPVFYQIDRRVEGHLFISVLAYHFVHTLRLPLKARGIDDRCETLATQQRVTATLQRRDGRAVHVRKATRPEPYHQRINEILDLSPNPVPYTPPYRPTLLIPLGVVVLNDKLGLGPSPMPP